MNQTLLHYYLSIIHWLAASREVEVWKELCPGFSAFPNCGLPRGDFGVCAYISMLTRETRERCSARGIGAWTQPNRVWIKFIHEESILFSRLSFNFGCQYTPSDVTWRYNDDLEWHPHKGVSKAGRLSPFRSTRGPTAERNLWCRWANTSSYDS